MIKIVNNENQRTIILNNKNEESFIHSFKRLNVIKTARYSLLFFLPKNLYDQFNSVANIYFLAIGIMQMVPSISSSGGIPTIALPLICMLCFSAAQAAYEDWKRHKADSEINNLPTYAYDPIKGNFVITKWGELKNGDLVIVKNREIFPADMVLLASSQNDNRVFVETASMDGETNLKLRESPRILFNSGVRNISDLLTISIGIMYCGDPNDHPKKIHINSKFLLKNSKSDEKELNFSCNSSNMLLRGCKLRNTSWALGAVAYTAHETKIYQSNFRSAPHKMSNVQSLYNQVTVASFIFLLVICLSFGMIVAFIDYFGGPEWSKKFIPIGKMEPNESILKASIITFFTWIIVLANLIPIGMFFYLVISKVSQAIIITSDSRLTSQNSTVVRNSDLNDELGQISYICTDKTGTLTRNYMEFKTVCINGNVYGGNHHETKQDINQLSIDQTGKQKITPHVDMEDETLRKKLREGNKEEIEILLNFALNHTVLIQENEVDIDEPPLYSASSTDEEALVLTSHHFGISLVSQNCSKNTIKFSGIGTNQTSVEFETLLRFEFDHKRKISSVLVKFPKKIFSYESNDSEGYRYILFSKGSESAIKECCINQENSGMADKTFEFATEFATHGYRTLCFAKKELNEDEFLDILRSFKDNKINLEEVRKFFESNLILQGCSGIEDILQYRAQETIESFIVSGIKVWMLTGDRQETAINIAVRVGIISDEMEVIIFDENELELFSNNQIKEISDKSSFLDRENSSFNFSNVVLVIDSQMLEKALIVDQARFAKIATKCSSVVCSRVTPQQKAQVVRLIQEFTKQRVLAIGDGGNDCTMLQTANVGVGIHGSEGMQAYNVSDFGISQFCHLQPLVLIHGRLCYRRTSILVLYNLYKCFTLNIVSVYFGFASLFTGSKLFFELLFQLYNFLYTSIPPIIFATFDSDIPITLPYDYHEPLYLLGITKPFFSLEIFGIWSLNAIFHAAVSLFIPYFILGGNNPISNDGYVPDFWITGLAVYTNVVIVVNTKILLEAFTSWSLVLFSVIICAILFFVSILSFPCIFHIPELELAARRAIITPMFIITILISITLTISLDWILKIYKRSLYPETSHLLQNKWYKVYKKKYESHRQLLLKHLSLNWLESMRRIKRKKSVEFEQIQVRKKSSDIIGYAFNYPDVNVSQLFLSNKTI
ncbi:calcium transporting ATpase or aminophospholipid transporter [Cryptosporidium sp. chipmunk genotype I]|uniref:calcium transporting ATpase or aminophospholipid transporter n=1 Tax=Cryptosporidium sp. chipmunk genotype I TaxID=1280935 RepID=UPI003519FE3E|nr:calcium transporting ATpase or aminophospholipid transporter [Cryptosporidium sp. chipmunk genotype I]